MTLFGKLTSIFMPIFLWFVFFFGIRKRWTFLIRWFRNEHPEYWKPIRDYKAPGNIEDAMSNFLYRGDPFNGQLDYISHPEYVQAVLDNPNINDGDCDDGHFYVANALRKCIGVTKIYYLSSGFSSKKNKKSGAHATCVYKYHDKWYHYDWSIYEIDDPNNAPLAVAKRYTKDENAKVTYWVWENAIEEKYDSSKWTLIGINTRVEA